jgi:hypothetical protein
VIQALYSIGLDTKVKLPDGKPEPAPCVKLAELVQNKMFHDVATSTYSNLNTEEFWKKKQRWVIDAMGPMIQKLLAKAPEFAKLQKAFDDAVAHVRESVVEFEKMDAAAKV